MHFDTFFFLAGLAAFLVGLSKGGLPAVGMLAVPLLSLPLAVKLIRRFQREAPGPVFNNILAATAGLQLTFALLLSLAFTI